MKRHTQQSSRALFSLALITLCLVLGAMSVLWWPHVIVPVLYVALPLAVFFGWKMELFVKIKLGTLIAGAMLYVAALFQWMNPAIVMTIFVWLLRLNIVEAVIEDIKHKKYFGVISGGMLLLSMSTMVFTWDGITYHAQMSHIGLWAVAYTLWNANFILGQFGAAIGLYHVAILSAPWVGVLLTGDMSLWVMMRGFTLRLGGMGQIVYGPRIEAFFALDWVKSLKVKIETVSGQACVSVIVSALCLTVLTVR
jgi:hypothetical protein